MSGHGWSTQFIPDAKVYYAGVVVETCACGASFWYGGDHAKTAAYEWRTQHQHTDSEGAGSGEGPASSVQTSGAVTADSGLPASDPMHGGARTVGAVANHRSAPSAPEPDPDDLREQHYDRFVGDER